MNSGVFTQIPNDLLEILMSRAVSKGEAVILLYIARQTFGYHRKTAHISRREFHEKLGISFHGITYILSRLQLVHLVALVNKGNSRLASSEWMIDTTDYPRKLVHLGALVKSASTGAPQFTSQLVHRAAETGAPLMPTTEPVNKLNKRVRGTENRENNKHYGGNPQQTNVYSESHYIPQPKHKEVRGNRAWCNDCQGWFSNRLGEHMCFIPDIHDL